MSDLVAIAYPNDARAAEVLDAITRLRAGGAIGREGPQAVAMDVEGRIKPEGVIGRTAAGGADGVFLGTLVDLVFFAPMLGALFGATCGAVAGRRADIGPIDRSCSRLAEACPPAAHRS